MIRITGEGPTIVFVHGNGSTHETWAGVVQHLPSFRCVTYDLPGHGGPTLPAGALELSTFVEDLAMVIDRNADGRIFLVGHSLGAYIAAGFALQSPERVAALGLMAAPVARTAADVQAGAALIDALRREGVRAVMGRLVQSWYTDEFVRNHPEALRARLAQIDDLDDDVFIRTYELYLRTEIDAWLPRIAIPTIVMTGESARGAGRAAAEHAARRLPDAQVRIFEGYKNGILTEIPQDVAMELARFLASASRLSVGT
ncbi:MAG: alpha/beta fold hydrolase [Alphaproteobacteria bacterium]|nr:alpha/beta fold hydrolase [Alphaproteobacteria bacterium]